MTQSGHCNLARGSNTFQVLDQILLVCVAEVELEVLIVVVHHVEQGCKATIMEEATLLMGPEPCERCRAVHVGWRAVGLERVDPNLARFMHVKPRLGVERRYVASRTLA